MNNFLESSLDQMDRIREIQLGYILIVEKYFLSPYNESLKHGVSVSEIAWDMINNPRIKKITEDKIKETFLQEIKEYWDKHEVELRKNVRNLTGSKLYFGGDIAPENPNVVNRLGLYSDTIIIPDPISKMGQLFKGHLINQEFYYRILKYSLTVLQYKSAIFAETEQPLVIIAPSTNLLGDESLYNNVTTEARRKTTTFMSQNTNMEFDDFQSVMNHYKKTPSYDSLKSSIINPEAFLFDSNVAQRDFDTQFQSLVSQNEKMLIGEIKSMFGDYGMLPFTIMGRMSQSLWHIAESEAYRATPFQDAYVSWHYLKWQMESAEKIDEKTVVPSVLLEDQFSILSQAPLDLLIKLRKEGELQEIRKVLSYEVHPGLSDAEKEENIKRIQHNINEKLKQHVHTIDKLSEDYLSSLKLDKLSLLSSGFMSAVAMVTNPYLALLPTVIGGSNVWNMAEKKDAHEQKKEELDNSFWGFYISTTKKH
jgi:hypothetical protein